VADSAGVSNPVEITNDAYEDIMPQFSPDGKKGRLCILATDTG
jgi:hypothetical protein